MVGVEWREVVAMAAAEAGILVKSVSTAGVVIDSFPGLARIELFRKFRSRALATRNVARRRQDGTHSSLRTVRPISSRDIPRPELSRPSAPADGAIPDAEASECPDLGGACGLSHRVP